MFLILFFWYKRQAGIILAANSIHDVMVYGLILFFYLDKSSEYHLCLIGCLGIHTYMYIIMENAYCEQ